jgi:hypothetical protein
MGGDLNCGSWRASDGDLKAEGGWIKIKSQIKNRH